MNGTTGLPYREIPLRRTKLRFGVSYKGIKRRKGEGQGTHKPKHATK